MKSLWMVVWKRIREWLRAWFGFGIQKHRWQLKRPPTSKHPPILLERQMIKLLLKEYGKAGTTHILQVLQMFAKTEGRLSIVEFVERGDSFYGEYYILREQRGPLGHKQVQLVVFYSREFDLFFVAGIYRRWTRFIRSERLEYFGNQFAEVEKKAKCP